MRLYSIYFNYASKQDIVWSVSILGFFVSLLFAWCWFPIDPVIIKYMLIPLFIVMAIISSFPMLVSETLGRSNIISPAEALRFSLLHIVKIEGEWQDKFRRWARENNIEAIYCFDIDKKVYLGFKKKDDALLFKLTWVGNE